MALVGGNLHFPDVISVKRNSPTESQVLQVPYYDCKVKGGGYCVLFVLRNIDGVYGLAGVTAGLQESKRPDKLQIPETE